MADRPHLDLAEYLPYLINRIGAAFVARYERDLAEHGLSIAMWRVLAALSTSGKQRQIDVAQATSIDVSTMSRLVSRLMRLELVTRTRSDTSNREVNVELTRKGRALVNRLIPQARRLEGEAVAGLAGADLAITRQTLRRMYDKLAGGVADTEAPRAKRARKG